MADIRNEAELRISLDCNKSSAPKGTAGSVCWLRSSRAWVSSATAASPSGVTGVADPLLSDLESLQYAKIESTICVLTSQNAGGDGFQGGLLSDRRVG